jgi:hypothetical protein
MCISKTIVDLGVGRSSWEERRVQFFEEKVCVSEEREASMDEISLREQVSTYKRENLTIAWDLYPGEQRRWSASLARSRRNLGSISQVLTLGWRVSWNVQY